jgi:hypothetical protein
MESPSRAEGRQDRRVYSAESLPVELLAALAVAQPSAHAVQFNHEAQGMENP